ncbi:hypothetical protein PPSIR1_00530 [Plesiocystis pacifica SIR-1]|uniref:DAGKc domain-containing protein n=1 Tax=Plesiocystis pacifica SIR-1 TaxID=391625 RepID=A6G7G4_9BACT|nr:diacylglycerol kinase family protein [Plesiocystis pacifica]EDM78173.1 hypothetical protein PPSIR1_00530 [Plesiocystis pacifica SIR-1]
MQALTQTLDRHLRESPSLFLVLNPNAGSVRRLLRRQGADAGELNPRLHLTANLDELTALFERLPVDRSQTVCFYGGDGTIARGLSAMINSLGPDAPRPVILPVAAGTINVLAEYLGFSESPELTLSRLPDPTRLRRTLLPSLDIRVDGHEPIYGFMFAWGVGYRVLDSYYSRRDHPTVADAAVTMAQTFAQSLHPRASEQPVFARHDLAMVVDGQPLAAPASQHRLHSLIVGTLAQTTMGFRPLPPEAVAPERFHFSGNGMAPAQCFRHSFPLLFARGDQRELEAEYALVARANVEELRFRIREGFTLDGEMVAVEGERDCCIRPGPMIEFWSAAPS